MIHVFFIKINPSWGKFLMSNIVLMEVTNCFNKVVKEVSELFIIKRTSRLDSFSEIGQQIEFLEFDKIL